MASAILQSFFHPTEIKALFQVKFSTKITKCKGKLTDLALTLNDRDFCYAVLNKVSRSFAVVIQQLPEELKDAVCIFYLVLRGLDSIEDDMTLDDSKKLRMLASFPEDCLTDGWNVVNVGDGPHYRTLLANFEKVITVLKGLKKEYQDVIIDITERMGEGMAKYVLRPTALEGVETCELYDEYCYYVAGLVGVGLSQLFAVSGLEDERLASDGKIRLSDSMGKFLQKTNIIRDYLEDLNDGRTWWPKEIWSQHGPRLAMFAGAPSSDASLACLNHMVTDALQHLPDCLEYLSMLHNTKILEFCAIPQVMAIATLAKLYNNPKVFTSVVKIRKGLSCKIMLNCGTIDEVTNWIHTFASTINVVATDPSASRTSLLLAHIKDLTRPVATAKHLSFGNGTAPVTYKLNPKKERVCMSYAVAFVIFVLVFLAYRYTFLGTENADEQIIFPL